MERLIIFLWLVLVVDGHHHSLQASFAYFELSRFNHITLHFLKQVNSFMSTGFESKLLTPFCHSIKMNLTNMLSLVWVKWCFHLTAWALISACVFLPYKSVKAPAWTHYWDHDIQRQEELRRYWWTFEIVQTRFRFIFITVYYSSISGQCTLLANFRPTRRSRSNMDRLAIFFLFLKVEFLM